MRSLKPIYRNQRRRNRRRGLGAVSNFGGAAIALGLLVAFGLTAYLLPEDA